MAPFQKKRTNPKKVVANKRAEKLMSDNPDAVEDFMQNVRSNPRFCVDVYKGCPGMQEVLRKNPDLRKIFEDPEKMRASFEAVYRKNGGRFEPLDDDEEAGDDNFVHEAMMEDDCYDGPRKTDDGGSG
eukprot:CAMPEP_0113591102 /NCGR_PEP_ID=MMETSP0015_2-20120614/37062_1 /TAXON_ID=2838 /ORGANISM="Odontella" /LENGTH=127 /DNA_ID=CAMNT_0000497405 /DNA_START=161 /DNA_END=540 /DNA_ORIENTATION=- /assembly_acc=CAM_ASM_000160